MVEYLSDRYFELAKNDKVAKILALGNEVIFRNGKGSIRVVDRTEQADNGDGNKEGEGSKEGKAPGKDSKEG